MTIPFDRRFDPAYGEAVAIADRVRRLTAPNPGPFTFHGTNCYLIGTDTLTVVDPGPDDPAQTAAILSAAGGRPISHILVTHTHRDHSPGARTLAAATGAVVAGAAPHGPARALHPGEPTGEDASIDMDHRPDRVLGDGAVLDTAAGRFTALATPGHTANHLCFALDGTDLLFSGDHVMAWSTTIVAPPDGSMADYMGSLDRIAAAPQRTYLPGHGGPVIDGPAFVAALRAHRLERAAAVLAAVAAGAATVPAIVAAVYQDTDRALWRAAGLSVFAQLEWLVARGKVASDGEPRLGGEYRVAG